MLSELLANGFTLESSFQFLMVVMPKKKKEIKGMNRKLLRGASLSETLTVLGLTTGQKAQLSFAEVHGDIVGTLSHIAEQMSDKEKKQQHLAKVVSYPCLLLLFLSGVLLGMKWYILPQLTDLYAANESTNLALVFVEYSPEILVGCLLLIVVITLVLKSFLGKKSAVEKANWWSKVPVVGSFFMSYYTSLFATEWGKLLTQGMEFREVVMVMNGKNYTPLMKEMAQTIEKKIEKGISINGPIKEWRFLKPELNLILLQGEVKGDLGKELLIYGKKEWEYLLQLAEKKMKFLQPLMFLLIAILIVSVYAALLLPIYSGMGDMY